MSLVMQTSVRVDPFGDPVIGDVGAGFDGDHGDVWTTRWADRARAVGDDEYRQRQPVRDPIDFVANRAGVAVDVEGYHVDVGLLRRSSPFPTAG